MRCRKKGFARQVYEKGYKEFTELTHIFDDVKFIFKNTHLHIQSFSHLCWESFVRDARAVEHDNENPDAPKISYSVCT